MRRRFKKDKLATRQSGYESRQTGYEPHQTSYESRQIKSKAEQFSTLKVKIITVLSQASFNKLTL